MTTKIKNQEQIQNEFYNSKSRMKLKKILNRKENMSLNLKFEPILHTLMKPNYKGNNFLIQEPPNIHSLNHNIRDSQFELCQKKLKIKIKGYG